MVYKIFFAHIQYSRKVVEKKKAIVKHYAFQATAVNAKQLKVYQISIFQYYQKIPYEKLFRLYIRKKTLFSNKELEIMLLFTVQEPFGQGQIVKLEILILSNN